MDRDAAAAFLTRHARLLDRLRFALLTGTGGPGVAEAMLAALAGYRNADGGYGWGIEPDLRDQTSQPAGALHAFEVLAELPATVPGAQRHAEHLCNWLDRVARPDGGLPFALPVASPAGVAPFWASADPTSSSLQISAAVTACALRVPAVAGHPWLRRSVEYCLQAIDGLQTPPFAIEFSYCLQLLDAVADPAADALLARLGGWLPEDGLLPVAGGAAGETLRALDVSPWPERPLRRLYRAELIEAELDRLDRAQQPDGGWSVDFDSYSAAGALEWRGYATVRAVAVLQANARS